MFRLLYNSNTMAAGRVSQTQSYFVRGFVVECEHQMIGDGDDEGK